MNTTPETTLSEPSPSIQPPVHKRRSWIKPLILAVIVFLGGGVAGGAGTLMFIHRHLGEFIRHPEEAPQKLMPILKRRLGLDEEQSTKIEAIIREHHRELLEIRYEVAPRVRTELDAIQTEVSGILTPSQRGLWDRRMTQLTNFWFPTLPPLHEEEPAEKP